MQLAHMPSVAARPPSNVSGMPVVYDGMILPTPLKPAVLAVSPFSVSESVPHGAYELPGLFIVFSG